MSGSPTTSRGSLVLALNCGSSSIKFAVFDCGRQPLPRVPLWSGSAQGIGGPTPTYGERGGPRMPLPAAQGQSYAAALRYIREALAERLAAGGLAVVVHRVVHGGERYGDPVRLDEAVLADLAACIPLAPLHQPHALEAIRLMLEAEPGIPQFACFDTAFHRSLPAVERLLPLPPEATDPSLRRYGFHGLSYAYLATVLPERHGGLARGRTIAAHLGSGASLCAMHELSSVATTMGFSALEGLMMGTRSGSIDPGVLLHLLQVEHYTPERLSALLYHESGLLGVSGLSSDLRVIAEAEPRQDEAGERARLALALYVRRIVREIGALTAVLGGLDLLVFTAGVGEHSALVRTRVCADLQWLGVQLDEEANARHAPVISRAGSRVRVAIEPANEEWLAATQALIAIRHGTLAHPAGGLP